MNRIFALGMLLTTAMALAQPEAQSRGNRGRGAAESKGTKRVECCGKRSCFLQFVLA